jgi:cyclophilin family peptidyl-prolyl cis-trans isomerase
MKKNTLIFIATSTFLGLALIFSLNNAKPNSQNLDDINNIPEIEIDDLEQQVVSNKKQEQDYSMPATLSANKTLAKPQMLIDSNKNYSVTLNTEQGSIVIQLDTKNTPITSNNFVYLAQQGFYDGTIFHRIIDGFMIQGGDPRGDGTGSPGYRFDDEDFTGEYQRGTVAMANSGPNTNGSQFFIMHQDFNLPKNYIIFGQVVEGIEVVDAIATAPVTMSLSGERSRPVEPVVVESAVVSNL